MPEPVDTAPSDEDGLAAPSSAAAQIVPSVFERAVQAVHPAIAPLVVVGRKTAVIDSVHQQHRGDQQESEGE